MNNKKTHIAFWISAFCIAVYMNVSQLTLVEMGVIKTLVNFAVLGLAFYLNYFFLLPNFWQKNKHLSYGVLSLAIILLTSYFRALLDFHYFFLYLKPQHSSFKEIHSAALLLSSVAMFGSSNLLFFVENYVSEKQKSILLENQKLAAEINFLRHQINPHFLFNAINNIHSQIYLNQEKASETLVKLSEMLRYMVYECNADNVNIENEVAHIQNILYLHKIKSSKEADIQFEANVDNNTKIHPLIFIVFIENALYYSGVPNTGFVHISLTQHNNKIKFECTNSIDLNIPKRDKESSGVGLENVKKRLDLVYPKKHKLVLYMEKELYKVELEIEV